MSYLLRNAHAVARNGKPMRYFRWLCDLEAEIEVQGGQTYRNEKSCAMFTNDIALSSLSDLADDLKASSFVSETSNGAGDVATTEQELVFISAHVQ